MSNELSKERLIYLLNFSKQNAPIEWQVMVNEAAKLIQGQSDALEKVKKHIQDCIDYNNETQEKRWGVGDLHKALAEIEAQK